MEKLRLIDQQKKREHEERMMQMHLEIARVQYGYNSGLGGSSGGGSSFAAGGSASSTPADGLVNSPFITPPDPFDTPTYAPSVSGESYVGLLLNNSSNSSMPQ